MFNEVGELIFMIGGAMVALLLMIRMRRLSGKERNAAVTAAVGLFLCGRYAALIQTAASWIFAVGVGVMMFVLAYNSLGFAHARNVQAD